MIDEAVSLDFAYISDRLRTLVDTLPCVDVVVGIATGGIVPAAMVAHQLGVPLRYLHLNYRAPDNTPRHESPVILADFSPPAAGARVLLVDDVSVSGSTLNRACDLLVGCTITTFVLKGQADYVVFPDVTNCVNWPWRHHV